MASGIYFIENLITKQQYIGSAVKINKRWNSHRCELRANVHKNKKLQNAWNKYGEDNFQFKVIEFIEPKFLIDREQFYLDTVLPFYNIRKVANSNLGISLSEETKRKMRKPKSQQTKLAMSLSRKGKTYEEIYGENANFVRKKNSISATKRQARKVGKFDKEGRLIEKFDSVKDSLLSLNVLKNTSQISNAIKLKKPYKKFYWQYL